MRPEDQYPRNRKSHSEKSFVLILMLAGLMVAGFVIYDIRNDDGTSLALPQSPGADTSASSPNAPVMQPGPSPVPPQQPQQ